MMQVKQKAANAWKQRVRSAGLRVTGHRLRVLALLEASRRPVTHLELYEHFEPGLVDRTTVFRNLMSLVRAGLVVRADQGDHLWRYTLVDRPRPAASFVCERCGQVHELPPMTVSFASRQLPSAVTNWQCAVKFIGVCEHCN